MNVAVATPDPHALFHMHFKVDSHSLPLDEFVRSAEAAEKIIKNLNDNVFQGKVTYKLVIYAPERGTLLETIGIVITSYFVKEGVKATFSFLESDMGKGLVKGLTGKEPAEIMQDLGVRISETIASSGEDIKKKVMATVIAACAAGLLTKSSAEIEALGLNTEPFRPALEGRNEFYNICEKNKAIEGVGFDKTDIFPIERSDFAKRIIELPEKIEEQNKWSIETVTLRVESPTWNPNGRPWVGVFTDIDGKTKDAHFKIEDAIFWGKVSDEAIEKIKVGDTVKVEWARPKKRAGGAISTRVLRVLDYNDQPISNKMTDVEMQIALDGLEYQVAEPTDDQLSLFE